MVCFCEEPPYCEEPDDQEMELDKQAMREYVFDLKDAPRELDLKFPMVEVRPNEQWLTRADREAMEKEETERMMNPEVEFEPEPGENEGEQGKEDDDDAPVWEVGHRCDACDEYGTWYEGKVVETRAGGREVKMHFAGWRST